MHRAVSTSERLEYHETSETHAGLLVAGFGAVLLLLALGSEEFDAASITQVVAGAILIGMGVAGHLLKIGATFRRDEHGTLVKWKSVIVPIQRTVYKLKHYSQVTLDRELGGRSGVTPSYHIRLEGKDPEHVLDVFVLRDQIAARGAAADIAKFMGFQFSDRSLERARYPDPHAPRRQKPAVMPSVVRFKLDKIDNGIRISIPPPSVFHLVWPQVIAMGADPWWPLLRLVGRFALLGYYVISGVLALWEIVRHPSRNTIVELQGSVLRIANPEISDDPIEIPIADLQQLAVEEGASHALFENPAIDFIRRALSMDQAVIVAASSARGAWFGRGLSMGELNWILSCLKGRIGVVAPVRFMDPNLRIVQRLNRLGGDDTHLELSNRGELLCWTFVVLLVVVFLVPWGYTFLEFTPLGISLVEFSEIEAWDVAECLLVSAFCLLTFLRLKASRVVLLVSRASSSIRAWTGFERPILDDLISGVTSVFLTRELRRAGRDRAEAIYRISAAWPGHYHGERDLVGIRDEANAIIIAQAIAARLSVPFVDRRSTATPVGLEPPDEIQSTFRFEPEFVGFKIPARKNYALMGCTGFIALICLSFLLLVVQPVVQIILVLVIGLCAYHWLLQRGHDMVWACADHLQIQHRGSAAAHAVKAGDIRDFRVDADSIVVRMKRKMPVYFGLGLGEAERRWICDVLARTVKINSNQQAKPALNWVKEFPQVGNWAARPIRSVTQVGPRPADCKSIFFGDVQSGIVLHIPPRRIRKKKFRRPLEIARYKVEGSTLHYGTVLIAANSHTMHIDVLMKEPRQKTIAASEIRNIWITRNRINRLVIQIDFRGGSVDIGDGLSREEQEWMVDLLLATLRPAEKAATPAPK